MQQQGYSRGVRLLVTAIHRTGFECRRAGEKEAAEPEFRLRGSEKTPMRRG